MTKLMLISFFMLVVANVLVAQSSFTVTLGTNREYHIDAQPSISNYLWEVYNDANLTVLTSSADVTLASLGVGREHEIEVTWNTLGTYYLTISVTDTSCTNKMAYTFEVIANNLPSLVNDTNFTTETAVVDETHGSGNILENDIDADGDDIYIASIDGDDTGSIAGTYGTLVWDSLGDYTYTPNSDLDSLYDGEVVSDVFNVTVSDSKSGTATSTLTITISGENVAPIAQDDSNSTIEINDIVQGAGIGNLLANDSDVDGDALIITSIDGDATGTIPGTYGNFVWNSDGSYTYTPNNQLDSLASGETVIETFTYTVIDGNGGTDTAILTITINGANQVPLLVANTNSTEETLVINDGSAGSNGNLLANDSDIDGEILQVDSIAGTVGNTATGLYGNLTWYSNGSYTYVPNAEMDSLYQDEDMIEVFTYYASDESGGVGSTTLTITINGENDIPVLVDNFNSTIKSSPITEVNGNGNLLYNDIDIDGDDLTITSIEGSTNDTIVGVYGILIWDPTGTYIYEPNAGLDSLDVGESVVEIFTYQADDPYGGYDTAALTITINGANDAPVLAEDTNSTNDIDPVSDKSAGSSGTLLINDFDGNGDVLTITDIDGITSASNNVPGIYGSLDWDIDGTYTYTPNVGLDSLDAGEIVTETFTYIAVDGNGGSDTTLLTITITGLNDAPVLADNSNSTTEADPINHTDGDGSLLSNDSDPNGNSLTLTQIDGIATSVGSIPGTYGTLTWNSLGEYDYIPNTDLDSLYLFESVVDSFTYTAIDGLGGSSTANLSITINGDNEPPVLVDDSNATVETIGVSEDGSNSTGNILANDIDIDGDVLEVASINGEVDTNIDISGIYGTLEWDSDGTYTYTPNTDMDSLAAGESVIETFSVSVNDGNGGIVASTLTITINGANAAPLADNDTNTTTDTTAVSEATGSGNLLLNDSDIDDDVLVIASINGEIDDTKDVVGEYGELNWNSDGTYIYTPHSELDTLAFGESVVETFTQTISDGNGGTTTATLSITINGVNDAPIFANDINSTIKSAAIDETDGSGSLLINDRDIDGNVLTVTQIETATTTAVATSTGIIAGEYGTLTWLADGTYDYNPNIGMDSLDAGEIVVETFIYTASDGLESGSATLTITISGANVAPVLADDSNSTLETDVINTVLDGFGNVTDNDTDDNGDALAITNIDGTPTSTGIITGQYGTLEWLADGEYIYTPNTELDSLTAGENVTDDFILTISDGNGEGGTTTLTITINGENDLPLLVDDTNSTIEILAVNQGDGSGNILDNDTDLEGSTLSIAEINGISNPSTNVVGTFGSLDWDEDGNYVYTPNSDLDSLDLGETVTETFIVSVSDGNGGFAESTLTITISGANDAPIAQNDTNSTIEILVVNDLVGSGTLLQNDNDVDGDIISILNIDGITSPSSDVVGTYGSLNWEADGSYIYTPNADMDSLAAGESVDDVFIYTISDGNGASDTATLTISISGENAAPVLVDDTNLTTEEDIITNADGSGTLLYNDIDPDGQLLLVSEIEGESDPLIDIVGTYGTLNWNIDGTYAYTPNDGLDSLAAGEDVADVFTYTATDGTESATAVLTITVRGANTDPVLLADTNATIKTTSVDEDDANSSGNILVNDNDPDGDVLEIYSIGGELTGTSVGTYGSLIWNPDGTYTYIPNSGMDSLSSSDIVYEVYTYVAVDNKGGSSISTLTITLTGENEAPILANDTNSTTKTAAVSEDGVNSSGNLLDNDNDPDLDAITITEINGVSNPLTDIVGTYGILNWNFDGTYTYTPNADMVTLSAGESFNDVFIYTATDGIYFETATLTITINGENVAPIAQDDNNSTIEINNIDQNDGSGNLLVNDTDVDGDVLIITSIDGDASGTIPGEYGVFVWNADGTYTYSPNAALDSLASGETVTETFTYTVIDGNGGTDTAILTITINGANRNPVANNDTNETIEGITVTEVDGNGNLLTNDTDLDGDQLIVSRVDGSFSFIIIGTHGTLTWAEDGTYSYEPNTELDSLAEGESVIETFNIEVSDPFGGFHNSTLTITINGIEINEAPIANTDYVGIIEDAANTLIDVLDNDTDPNGDDLIVTIIENPISGGSANVINGTEVTYNPPANYNGNDYFVYQICDGGTPTLCDIDTVFVEIQPVNDPPVAVADYVTTAVDATDVSVVLLANDFDVDGDELSTSIVSNPTSGGIATIVNDILVYNPPIGFVGVDTIIYEVCDNGTPVLCDIDTVFISVIDEIEAVDDVLSIYAGEIGTIDIDQNDKYIEDISITIIETPIHGDYELNDNGVITYTADSDYYGNDTITYVISNTSGSDTAIVVITINPIIELTTSTYCVDEIPHYSWNVETVGVTLNAIDLIIYDSNNELVDHLEDVALSGSREWPGYTVVSEGALYGVPSILETINLNIAYQFENESKEFISTLNVPNCHVNTVVAVWDTATIYGEETILNILANDFDNDDGDIDTTSVSVHTDIDFAGPYHGEVVVNNDGTISYTPDEAYMGLDSFMYQICDDYIDRACDTAIVRLNVIFNDELIAFDDSYSIYRNQPSVLDVANNDYDPEGELDLTSIVIIVDPENGNVISNNDGTVSYQPLPSFEGIDSFQYVICDMGEPQDCDSAWVYVNVHENVCISAHWDDTLTYVHEEVVIEVLNNDFDYEEELDSTTLSVVSLLEFDGPYHGETFVNNDGTITYVPDSLFAGIDSFIYRICDFGYPSCCDTAVVYVAVIDNNMPIVASTDRVLVLQNNEFDIPILNNDYDTDGLIDTTSITILNPPINGDATIDYEAGIISYNPEDGFNGLDSIIYSICDNGPIVSCDTAVVYITVTANLPPVALNDTIDAYWGINEPYVISINDYDPEVLLDSVSIEIITLPESGGISIDPETGIVSYMPDYCSTITDSFTYVIYDIQGNVSNIATVLININIDPEGDYDLDGVLDIVEDLNGNGNPCDDDTDGDNKPNFNDTDDDGDSVLTADEDFETPDGDPTNEDTDGDGIPNYLDNNDDGDCQLTIDEDHNQDGNVLNDDIDNDGRPDYLEEDDDNDGILSCDEMGDLDGNGIPDKEEIWNAKTLDDYETIDIDEVLVIDVLSNDSTQMNGSTILIIDEPNHGFVDINDDWTITYTPDLNFIGLDTFVYEVCDYQWHCDTAIVIINVEDLVVLPDLFTPNNDGQNDFYRIKGLYRHPGSTFIVFNRWGNKVYESNDYQQDWDGTSNVSTAVGDKVLPVGVYYCILEYGNGRDKAKAVFLKK